MFVGIEYLHLFLIIVFSSGDLARGRFYNLSKKIGILGFGEKLRIYLTGD